MHDFISKTLSLNLLPFKIQKARVPFSLILILKVRILDIPKLSRNMKPYLLSGYLKEYVKGYLKGYIKGYMKGYAKGSIEGYLKEYVKGYFSPRQLNTGLVSSRDSLISWGQDASVALVGHPSSDGVTIKMPDWVDVLHRPASHSIFSYWVS